MKSAVSVPQTLGWLVRIPVGIEGSKSRHPEQACREIISLECGKGHLLWGCCQERELSWSVGRYLEGISIRACCAFGSPVKRQEPKSLWGHLNCIESIPLHGYTSPKGRTDPCPGQSFMRPAHSKPAVWEAAVPGSDSHSVNKPLPQQMGQLWTPSWWFGVPALGYTHPREAQPGHIHFCNPLSCLVTSCRSRWISSVPLVLIILFLSESKFWEVQLK